MTADAERLARIYSAQARAYAETWSPIIGTAGRHLLETLPWRECKRVLDIGTGAGEHLPDIRRLAAGAWILGIDRSAGMLELARSHRVPLALMDGMDVALRPQSFDVALMIFMLFHLDDPATALRNVRAVLRPGGTLGAVTWAEDPDVEASRLWEAELDALGARDPDPIPRKHELMNTTEKMTALLASAGLTPQKLWLERLEHTWSIETLFALHTGFAETRLPRCGDPCRVSRAYPWPPVPARPRCVPLSRHGRLQPGLSTGLRRSRCWIRPRSSSRPMRATGRSWPAHGPARTLHSKSSYSATSAGSTTWRSACCITRRMPRTPPRKSSSRR